MTTLAELKRTVDELIKTVEDNRQNTAHQGDQIKRNTWHLLHIEHFARSVGEYEAYDRQYTGVMNQTK